jgi:hypothetical protein
MVQTKKHERCMKYPSIEVFCLFETRSLTETGKQSEDIQGAENFYTTVQVCAVKSIKSDYGAAGHFSVYFRPLPKFSSRR